MKRTRMITYRIAERPETRVRASTEARARERLGDGTLQWLRRNVTIGGGLISRDWRNV